MIAHLNMDSSLGIVYRDEKPSEPSSYTKCCSNYQGIELLFESRCTITGILPTHIEFFKYHEENLVIINVTMNNLLRLALYQVW
ncbi:type III PLP-dependent enzyme domain-containing protein [Candidatus Enterovibrio altilux]|uniref:hypothetical protein n=1 Tax=Candidatus Enterovibrio altilux TaxID=1927128 RepID=UPI000BBC7035|nr:hypothetical protein [Candidatus Enterovibrio luxaltus]